MIEQRALVGPKSAAETFGPGAHVCPQADTLAASKQDPAKADAWRNIDGCINEVPSLLVVQHSLTATKGTRKDTNTIYECAAARI
jgi:hypothetical protein